VDFAELFGRDDAFAGAAGAEVLEAAGENNKDGGQE
jgi:hypothetical protein